MDEIDKNLIPDWLQRRVLAAPESPALIWDPENPAQLSWKELQARALALAGKLNQAGVKAGDRVAFLMGNGRPFVEIFHALIQLKAVLVPLNTRLALPELSWQIQDCRASHLVFDRKNSSKIVDLGPEIPGLILLEAEKLESLAGEPSPPNSWIDLEALHTIIYSSGTTGRPKGVKLTYANHFWGAVASSLNLGNQRNDIWLAVLPLFHVGGLSILFRSLIYGIPALVHEQFDPGAVNRAIEGQGVTIVSIVSIMLQRMLEERGGKPYPPHLRCLLLGGGPVPLPLLERCQAIQAPVVQTYGMTETASQFVTLAPEEALRKVGSAGLPLLPNALKVTREGREVPAGEIGEIVVRGPSVSPGYDRRPEETAEAFRNGWFYTGDLGRLDNEGYLYVVDRRNDLIISGGENIYPAELEAVLLGHPAVEEAGVFGLPHEKWGAVPAAAVKLRPGFSATEESIIEWSASQLASYKRISRLFFVDLMPRNAGGKLLRRVLKEELSKPDATHGS